MDKHFSWPVSIWATSQLLPSYVLYGSWQAGILMPLMKGILPWKMEVLPAMINGYGPSTILLNILKATLYSLSWVSHYRRSAKSISLYLCTATECAAHPSWALCSCCHHRHSLPISACTCLYQPCIPLIMALAKQTVACLPSASVELGAGEKGGLAQLQLCDSKTNISAG